MGSVTDVFIYFFKIKRPSHFKLIMHWTKKLFNRSLNAIFGRVGRSEKEDFRADLLIEQ